MYSKKFFFSFIPNALTFLRLVIAVIIGIFLIVPHDRIIVQVLTIIGIVSDKLDGTLARRWKIESEFGKKIESLVDPLFLLSIGTYIAQKTDFPDTVYWIGLMITLGMNLIRVVIALKHKKLFYQKSQITRISTASICLIALLYLFAIPTRQWILFPFIIIGIISSINYLRMLFGIRRQIHNTLQ